MPVRIALIFLFFLLTGWTTPGRVLGETAMAVAPVDISVPDVQVSLDPGPETGSTGQTTGSAPELDLSGMRALLERLDSDVAALVPGFSLSRLLDQIKEGQLALRPDKLAGGVLSLLGREMLHSAPLIAQLIILAVLCAVLQQMQNAFGGTAGKMAQAMAYLVLLGLAMTSFRLALDLAGETVNRMVEFMQTLFPVMLTLLLAMGNVTTAALFKPIVLGSLTLLATIIKTFILPLFFLAAVLHLFNHISTQFQLKRLAGLLEFAGKTAMGLTLTIFIGVLAVQGVTGGVADGVVLRTAKYSADAIPVVGKFFKDAVEIVMGSGIMLRNALGIVAVVALVIICLGPIVKIVAMQLVFRISAALIEPLGEEALAKSLEQMSKSLFLIFGAVASVAMMFFLTVVIVVGTGNLTVMLR